MERKISSNFQRWMDAESESEVYFVSLISDRYGDVSLDDCHAMMQCMIPFSASHLLQGDSLSDGGHQIAPRVHSRGRRLRSGDLSELNLSALQRGQHFIHRSYENTAIKEKNDTFATMEEWREECIAGFQFQLREAAKKFQTERMLGF